MIFADPVPRKTGKGTERPIAYEFSMDRSGTRLLCPRSRQSTIVDDFRLLEEPRAEGSTIGRAGKRECRHGGEQAHMNDSGEPRSQEARRRQGGHSVDRDGHRIGGAKSTGIVSRFVSWDHREYLSEYSVDGLPGMTEQSGSRSSRVTQRRSTSCASPDCSKLLGQTMSLNTRATPGRRAIPRLLRPRSCPRVLAAPRPSVPGSLR